MSKHDDRVYAEHLRDALTRIGRYIDGLSRDQFVRDDKTQDAVIRQLEIIGEAAKQISPACKRKHTAVPWTYMAKMRDLLIHHYFGVDLDVVWNTAVNDLPPLYPVMEAILKDTEPEMEQP